MISKFNFWEWCTMLDHHEIASQDHRSRVHHANRVSPAPEQLQLKSRNVNNMSGESPQRKGCAFQQLPTVHCTSTSAPDGGTMGVYGTIAVVFCFVVVVCTFPFSLIFCLKIVQEFERVVIFRLGRTISGGSRGPGVFFFLPCIDKYDIVDLRTVSFDVPPQECLTRDSVTVTVDAVVFFRIENATVSITNVQNVEASTKLLAQTTLRNMIGTRILSDILTKREDLSAQMQMILDEATNPWGVRVERVEMKDVRLPVQLQRAMAAEAEATREASAKLICANGEKKASVALREAADTMHDSPHAMQLRYLQTLNTISAEKNSTIVFPLPIEFLNKFLP